MKNLGKFILLFSFLVTLFAFVSCNNGPDEEKMTDISSKEEISFSDGDYAVTHIEYTYGSDTKECKTADIIVTDFYEATFKDQECTSAKKSTKMVFPTEEGKNFYGLVKETRKDEEGVTNSFDDKNYTVTFTYENPSSDTAKLDDIKGAFFPKFENSEKVKTEISEHYAKQTEDASKMEYGYLRRTFTRTSSSEEWKASSPARYKIIIEKK